MKSSFAYTYNQTESTNLDSATIQEDDLSRVRHRKSSTPSFGRGGRGGGVALEENTKRGHGPTLKTEEKAEPIATLQDAIYTSPRQSMGYMDVCKDRVKHELFIKTIAYCRHDVTNKLSNKWWHR
jgi:hypothetical protein